MKYTAGKLEDHVVKLWEGWGISGLDLFFYDCILVDTLTTKLGTSFASSVNINLESMKAGIFLTKESKEPDLVIDLALTISF